MNITFSAGADEPGIGTESKVEEASVRASKVNTDHLKKVFSSSMLP